MSWKRFAEDSYQGYFTLQTPDTGDVPVRLFLTPSLLEEVEEDIYHQIVNATQFPGVKLVCITPDVHVGYGVPIGSVILTDSTVCLGPVGFDIGCGMMSARSNVPAEAATPDRKLKFNKEVMKRVEMGMGSKSTELNRLSRSEFEELVRGGAEAYIEKYGSFVDRTMTERNRIPVDDSWQIPWGDKGRPERGVPQLGSLGGGNHFMELQRCEETGTLFIQVHTGSRGFGHGLATNYFELAREEKPDKVKHIDLGYFEPDSKHYQDYLNAVAAGGNFAIINRIIIFEQLSIAFKKVFGEELELIYEISHNLVQREVHPEFGEVWVHRKGATRAFPAGYPALKGTLWETTGHPVLIPGSNHDYSYILRPSEKASISGYSVNHGAGRKMSRSAAKKKLNQKEIDELYRKHKIQVNDDGKVPLDEAGPCYKSSKDVINAVVTAGLATIEHKLWPLASLKGTE